jgi:hypothetical protein
MRNQAPLAEPDAPIEAVPADDYHVVGRDEPERAGAGARLVQGLLLVLILVLAVVTFAIFWVVGLLLNIF